MVGVDDPHLLDDLSMFVLDQVVQRGVAKVLLTLRDDEPIPVAIQELWKLGEFERVDLEPLSPDATTALLSATLDGSMDPQTARSLWQLTQGNILYLRHIVEQAVADGHLEVAERLLAVGRRPGRAARPGRAGRDADGRPARRGRRRRRRAGGRRADRVGDTAADHRSGRRRRGGRAWPDPARRSRRAHRSPAGAPVVRRGAEEPRGADEAAATARAVGGRTGGCRRRRGRAGAGSARGAERSSRTWSPTPSC